MSARRHKPRPENEASKRDARTPLTLGEARVQHAVETQDPAYIAAAQQLYDNIVSIPMEALLEGSATNPFPQLMDGRPVKIGRDELLEMDPEMAALRIVDPESYAQIVADDPESLASELESERMLRNLSFFDEGSSNDEEKETGCRVERLDQRRMGGCWATVATAATAATVATVACQRAAKWGEG